MQITGTYTLDNGKTYDIPNIPSIDVQVTSPTQQLATYLEQQDWVKAWNSNKFLRLFFNPPILVSSFPIVLKGFLMALAIVFVAFPLAIPVGLAFSFMRMSKIGILRGIGALYVNVVRGTPVFLQIYIAFFGLPLAGIQIPPFILGVIVLALNSAAYQCEIFRAGIQSISKGQFEAARSLGMSGGQTMAFVIIPQTIRRVLPTMTSEFILLYKDTSLLAAVGVMEIVMYMRRRSSRPPAQLRPTLWPPSSTWCSQSRWPTWSAAWRKGFQVLTVAHQRRSRSAKLAKPARLPVRLRRL